MHYFTHADKGIFQLLRALIVKRGIVAREYVEGRRRKYFPPLSFYLLVAAVQVFMMTIDQPSERVNVLQAHPELSTIADAGEKQDAIDYWTRRHNLQYFSSQYSNIFALFALPLTAAVFWMFYRKAKYNFIEHLVAGMYMLGFCLLVNAIFILPVVYLLGVNKNYGVAIFFVFQQVYLSVFYYGFLGKSTKRHGFKVAAVSFIALFAWVAFTSTLILTYLSNGFWGLL